MAHKKESRVKQISVRFTLDEQKWIKLIANSEMNESDVVRELCWTGLDTVMQLTGRDVEQIRKHIKHSVTWFNIRLTERFKEYFKGYTLKPLKGGNEQ